MLHVGNFFGSLWLFSGMVLSRAQFPLTSFVSGTGLKVESGNTVVMFDESLNTVTKRKQMDVHIRSWIDGQVR